MLELACHGSPLGRVPCPSLQVRDDVTDVLRGALEVVSVAVPARMNLIASDVFGNEELSGER